MIEDYTPTNRERSREPRGRSFWCGSCDRNHVWAGQTCTVCGSKTDGKKRSKGGKPTPK